MAAVPRRWPGTRSRCRRRRRARSGGRGSGRDTRRPRIPSRGEESRPRSRPQTVASRTPCGRPGRRQAPLPPCGEPARETRRGAPADFILEMSVKLNALPGKDLGQHDLGVEPRTFRPMTLEVIGGPGQQPSDGPWLFGWVFEARLSWRFVGCRPSWETRPHSVLIRGRRPVRGRRAVHGGRARSAPWSR